MRLLPQCLLLSRLDTRFLSPSTSYPLGDGFRRRPLIVASGKSDMNAESHRDICQLNHAGASPSPQSVIDRVVDHMKLEQSIGGYAAGQEAHREVQTVYQSISQLINCHPDEIALCESATVAWTRSFYSMVEKQLKANKEADIILISEAEYAANVVAASQFAKDKGWTVLAIPSSITSGRSTGIVDLTALDSMLSGSYMYQNDGQSIELDPRRIALVCVTHIPTNSGIVNPVGKIGQRISNYNRKQEKYSEPVVQILYLVDACQSIGQIFVDVEQILCDALVATGRKYLRGPRGSGFLFVSSKIVSDLLPNHIDHYGMPVSEVPVAYQDGDTIERLLQYKPRAGATRFEFWESNIANRLGLGIAVEECIRVGPSKIETECEALSKLLREHLAEEIPTIQIHHESSTSCGIVSFHSTNIESATIKIEMQKKGFELSVVPATSTPIDSAKTKVPDLVRASLSYTNTREDIEGFVRSLKAFLGD